ncbi:CHAD domain-containing protein [Mucilaginibacter gossypiicola]|uniref:CHAD domain-containing protein n=1 Tax=Mucilaginibacter gossypiicola TaxID=551995 RepID=A0A1H8TLF1_9SPHI|nr:CHAD domain-containing protein [Mucilaginibacter gossypiicola]SEO91308.1 CHAD domain-containing protein [Mucilaginibacter gossypiicola]
MKKETERKYVMKIWRSMKRHLRSFIKNGEQEDLHHFRTGVKKLRALLILADSAEKSPGLEKRFKPVRKIFKQAGEIRNAYINQELGKAVGENTDFMREQQQIMETATLAFNADKDQHRLRLRKTRRSILKRIRSVSKLHLTLYYYQQLESIATALNQLRFDESLHTCRKQLKVLLYNYTLAGPELEISFNEAYIDQVQEAIGNWHDNQLALELFATGETGSSDGIANGLKKQSARLKKQLTLLTRNFQEQATTVTELPIPQVD